MESVVSNQEICFCVVDGVGRVSLIIVTCTRAVNGDNHQMISCKSGIQRNRVDLGELRRVGAKQSRNCGNGVVKGLRSEGEVSLAAVSKAVASVTTNRF